MHLSTHCLECFHKEMSQCVQLSHQADGVCNGGNDPTVAWNWNACVALLFPIRSFDCIGVMVSYGSGSGSCAMETLYECTPINAPAIRISHATNSHLDIVATSCFAMPENMFTTESTISPTPRIRCFQLHSCTRFKNCQSPCIHLQRSRYFKALRQSPLTRQ